MLAGRLADGEIPDICEGLTEADAEMARGEGLSAEDMRRHFGCNDWRITYSPRSRRDLETICAYIAVESGSVETANRFIGQLLDGARPWRLSPNDS